MVELDFRETSFTGIYLYVCLDRYFKDMLVSHASRAAETHTRNTSGKKSIVMCL